MQGSIFNVLWDEGIKKQFKTVLNINFNLQQNKKQGFKPIVFLLIDIINGFYKEDIFDKSKVNYNPDIVKSSFYLKNEDKYLIFKFDELSGNPRDGYGCLINFLTYNMKDIKIYSNTLAIAYSRDGISVSDIEPRTDVSFEISTNLDWDDIKKFTNIFINEYKRAGFKNNTFENPFYARKYLQVVKLLGSKEEIEIHKNRIQKAISNKVKNNKDSFLNLSGLDFMEINNVLDIPYNKEKITNITIEHCGLTDFPERILDYKNLVTLLVGNNKLSNLPERICQLKNLKLLNIKNNGFTQFPKSILSLNNLEKLFLKRNQIKSIPDEISGLKNLSNISLTYNPVDNKGIERLKKLLPNCNIIVEKSGGDRLIEKYKFK